MLRCLVTLPPPVTGRTLATQGFLDSLAAHGITLDVRDLAPARQRGIFAMRLTKGLRTLRELIFLVLTRQDMDAVYLPLDHGGGLAYAVGVAFAARLRGLPLYLHHHVYAYLNRRSRLFALMVRCSPPTTVHLVLCTDMAHRLRQHYGVEHEILLVPNRVDATARGSRRTSGTRRPVLGLLSNLTFDKGLREAVEVWRGLRGEGIETELRLAGPVADGPARRYLDSVLEEEAGGIRWLGPVHGRDKAAFYDSLDWFLFPTRYRNEAQPLVVLEALGHGVPVIANDRGCIAGMLNGGGGRVIGEHEDFVERAVAFLLEELIDDVAGERLRVAARARFEMLEAEAAASLGRIRRRLASGS